MCRNPLHCIVPPYILDQLAKSDDPEVRNLAVDTIAKSAAARATRRALATMPAMAAIPSPAGNKDRLVYDAEHRGFGSLPGKLVRRENDGPTGDAAADEAFDGAGITYDFYKKVFNRNSLDDRGMTLISSVHLGTNLNNAFWTGEQMAYGDGDGQLFVRFTRSLDVVGHELTHGVVTHTSNLEYQDESGALNEHFADVFGALVKQWHLGQAVDQADWTIGADLMAPGSGARCLRIFTAEKAYENHPKLGTDPQPKHLSDKFTGIEDNRGVHINSGIPNHAFYLVAMRLGGNGWGTAGQIWYETMRSLPKTSDFNKMVQKSVEVANSAGTRARKVVAQAWKDVGF
ncbi:MAG: M4 family metallopeptidase [Longimicrobiaceae bacterium]